MTRLFILRPCRLSFALCVLIAFAVDPDHASHVTIGDAPAYAHRRFNDA